MRLINSILILFSLLYIIIACPNDCNKHGICNKNDDCECVTPFTGYDCSESISKFNLFY